MSQVEQQRKTKRVPVIPRAVLLREAAKGVQRLKQLRGNTDRPKGTK